MKRATVLAGLLMVTSLISGCGSVTSSTVAFHEEGFQRDDDAIIYLYRLKSMAGAAVAWRVKLDDKIVATLRQNAYIALHVTPGAHTLAIGDENPMAFGLVQTIVEAVADNPGAFKVKAKETYYVRSQGIHVDFLAREKAMDELKLMHYDMGQ